MNPEDQQPAGEQPAEKVPENGDGAQNTPVVQDVVAPNPAAQQPEPPKTIDTPAPESEGSSAEQQPEAVNEPPQEANSSPAKTKRKKNKIDPGLTKQYKPKKSSSTPLAFVVTVVAVALALMGLVVMSYVNQDEAEDILPANTEETIEPNGVLPEPEPVQDDMGDNGDVVADPDEPVSSEDDVTDEAEPQEPQPTAPNEVPAEQ